MNEPRRHHYVPKVYLRSFLDSNAHREQTYVCHKENKNIHLTEISNIAVKKDLYRVNDDGDEFKWERYYSQNIESLYPKILNQFSVASNYASNIRGFSNEMIDDISEIIVSQLLRTKKSLDEYAKISKKAGLKRLEEIKVELMQHLSEENRQYLSSFEVSDELVKKIGLDIINSPHKKKLFKSYLKKRTWIVYVNLDHNLMPLITSDHPVCMYNFISNSFGLLDNGIGLDTTTIFYPINTKILLAMYPNHMLFGELSNYDKQIVRLHDGHFFWRINRLQFDQAEQQVYSSSELLLKHLI